MKAIGYTDSLPISEADSLVEFDAPMPDAGPDDVLVKVCAISVNPVDYKIRMRRAPDDGSHAILGWDAVGEVITVGANVTEYAPGDRVFYAGDLNRPGSNAEFQAVDARIVGRKPTSLTDAQAAALPLTAITAWELLFEHLGIARRGEPTRLGMPESVLVIGAAGGVGSILIQLIKTLTDATVIATASRPASAEWVRALGADHVITHREPLAPQIDALAVAPITGIASLNATEAYFDDYPEILAPFGRIAMIDDPEGALNVMALKPRSQSLHIEFMFARSMFETQDIAAQRHLLNEVSALVDQGKIKTTVGEHLGQINAANLRKAHAELESGKAIGKFVLEGF
ncbi:MAG: zinc-binding alcohol dehydrogenase family protein [Pseudomonadota bacterium]